MAFSEEASGENLNERLEPFLKECLDPAIKKGEVYGLSPEEAIFGILQTVFMMCVVCEKYDVEKAEGYFKLMGDVAIKAYKQVNHLEEE